MEMQKRLGVVGIVVEDISAANEINAILHDSARIIIGRMGIPHRERGVSVLSLIVDGSTDEISALTGRLGRVPNTLVKTALTRDVHGTPDQAGKEA
jgi:putative iron-only hydrogenase system regulator